MQLPTESEAREMRIFERFAAAVKIDMELLRLKKFYADSGLANVREVLEAAALSRYYLTHDENSVVGYIHEGHLLLWCDAIEAGKVEAAREYVASEQGSLEL